jgi:uncharacterized tellurite resistance protein B-like protein
MLQALRKFFAADTPQKADPRPDPKVAVCALLLEMARIDDSFTEEELETVLRILRERYGLSTEEAEALIEAAEVELSDSVDLWRFARRINRWYSPEEKVEIIELLWRVVFVDGKLDAHEDYLIHKLEQLLRLEHRQLIAAKLKVLHSDGS